MAKAHMTAVNARDLVAPELRATLENFPNFDFTPELLAAIRAGPPIQTLMQLPQLTPEQEAVTRVERHIGGLNGAPDVRVLIYAPPGQAQGLRPAVLHIHGGGYIVGAPEMNDGLNRSFVAQLGCVVVSVDYRLAPETAFPGALEDCYAALAWLHAHADELNVDQSRIAITGESAGGGHAAALAIYARDRGEVPICFQLLDCPMLDDRTGSAADPKPDRIAVTWTAANNRFGWASLLGMEPGGPNTPAGASPARVENLAGLPPAFLIIGALDLFVEETLGYARRLMAAGVPTELHVIPGAFHGFSAGGDDIPQVRLCKQLRNGALARAFQRP